MTDSGQSDRWRRIKDIFSAALDQPLEERAEFLDRACEGDADLRAEVEDLLDADSGCGDFLDTPAVVEQKRGEASDALLNEQFENYRLTRVISTGGMGVVYEAEQDNPRRTVAVKVMKEGIASPDALRRFEFESQVLGGLRHPGIAQVFEAGTHHSEGTPGGPERGGVPFFVMEYVPDARSVTEYARKEKLGTKERVLLFTQVCDAVHHGHQKGIIHRDLKPANILVDAQGGVKVIDFGVARATDADLALTTQQTDVGQLIGTVQYMSPEQCAADPNQLDIRSDIYSLGVVLYELLCGQLPYDVRSVAIFEASRLIREKAPKRPSTVNRSLRGDVETIVLKALEKERSHRYQTLAALADDLNRYVGGEVILARPAGPATKAVKIIKRNPAMSLAAFVAVASLVAFLLYVVLWSYPRIRAEHARAVEAGRIAAQERAVAVSAKKRSDDAAEQARLINSFLKETFLSADPYRVGEDLDKHEMLDRAARRIENEFKDQPEIRASLHNTIGSVYVNRDFLDAAEEQIGQAIAIRVELYGPHSVDVFESQCYMSRVYLEQGRLDEAESILNEIRKFCKENLEEDHVLTNTAVNFLARVRRAQGRYTEAEQLLRTALAWETKWKGRDHIDTISTTAVLAGTLENLGRYGESEELHREALERRRALLGEDHPVTLQSKSNVANAALLAGKYDEAERMFREISEKVEDVMGVGHPDTQATMGNFAIVLKKQGKLDEAEMINREIHDQRVELLGRSHPLTLNSGNNLANVLKEMGRLTEAEDLLREAVEGRKSLLGPEHPDTLESLGNLGIVLNKQRKLDEAEAIQRSTWESRKKVLGETHPDTLTTSYNLGLVLVRRGKAEEGEEIFRRLLSQSSSFPDEDYPLLIDTMSNLAILLARKGLNEKAEVYFRRVLAAMREKYGNEHSDTIRSINNLALFLRSNEQPVEAEWLYREVFDLRTESLGSDHVETVKALARVALAVKLQERYSESLEIWRDVFSRADRLPAGEKYDRGSYLANIGDCFLALRRFDEAEEPLIESFTIYRSELGIDNIKTTGSLDTMIELYEAWGKPDEADTWRSMRDG